jgi:uncharacterized membrane protein
LRTDNLGKSALSTVIAISLLLSLFLVISGSHISVRAEVAAKVWTDKADYGPGETVLIFGENFASNDNITIRVIRPDSTDNTWIICDNSEGGFETSYQLDGIPGTYTVNAKDNHNNVAENTFTDTKPHFWISIDNINGIPGPTWENFSTATISLAGRVDVGPNFPGKLSDYQVQVDWGDNTVDNDSGINFVQSGTTFSGTWWSNPNHTYSASGTYTIIAKLYHGQPPGAESGDNYYQVTIVVILPPKGSISGSKWNDLSYNGVWDSGEPGLSGWTIQLYFFSTCDNKWINIDNENTGAGGSYKFSRLVAGNYRVNEVLKTGWIQTFPASPGIYNITLSEGENRNGINFGNVLAVRGVSVSISPSYENGLNGATLTYTVTVTNTGNASDTFLLTPTDNAGWSPSVSPNSLTLSPGTSDNATLSVTIPDNAIGGTKDNLKVTVTDNGVSGSGNCTAQVTTNMGTVQISFSPTYENGPNGAVLTYTVTVTNTGNVPNTYSLTATNSAGWPENVSPTSITIPAFNSDNATLRVTIPDNAICDTIDNVTVTATGTGVSGSGNCTAQVTINRGVSVSISLHYQGGMNGAVITYTVTVVNLGNVTDTYDIKASDNLGWDNIWLDDNALQIGGFDNENTTTLHVRIPDNAVYCTRDNVTVTAISRTDSTVKDNDSCIAHAAAIIVVDVSISPLLDNGLHKDVTITNMGNVVDNYNLTVKDNFGWTLMLVENQFGNVIPGENRVTALNVDIPENAMSGTVDGITVVATSKANTGVSDNATANITSIRGVEVSISPTENGGLRGERLVYTVTIWNTGNVLDNYLITKTDVLGWTANENWAWLSIAPGHFDTVIFDVIIPENVKPSAEDVITVTATSMIDDTVSDNATSIAAAPNLFAGWNLLHFPLISENNTPLKMFGSHLKAMKYWIAPNGPYKEPNYNAPVELGVGYWVDVDTDMWIRPTGVRVENFTLELVAGWNLIGFPVLSENTTPFNMFGVHLKAMKGWTAPNGPYVEPNYKAPVVDNLGYWVDVDEDMTVTIPL